MPYGYVEPLPVIHRSRDSKGAFCEDTGGSTAASAEAYFSALRRFREGPGGDRRSGLLSDPDGSLLGFMVSSGRFWAEEVCD